MTPDQLRLLTDPSARNDPEFVRRVRNEARAERRRGVFTILRVTSLVMVGLGPFLLGLSGLLAVGAIASRFLPLGVPGDALFAGVFLGVFGAVMSGLAVWLWVPGRGLLTSGVQAQATVQQVLGVRGGVTVKSGGTSGTVVRVSLVLRVMPPSGASYDVTHREPILDTDLGSLQLGATIPVRVSPTSPSKLLIDWDAMH